MNILLIEDNPADILLTKEGLREIDFQGQLKVLRDGEKAISFLSELNDSVGGFFPDLIFLDLNLPKRNGFDVLRHLQSEPFLRSLPTLILTTSDNQEERDYCRAMGASDYLVKPLEFSEYILLLRHTLTAWKKGSPLRHTA